MHTSSTLKQWTHMFHDGSAKVAHYTGHLLHEKSFWGILALLVLLAGALVLIAIFGDDIATKSFNMPYGPYY